MIGYLTKKIFGSRNDRFLKTLLPTVARINALEKEMQALSDAEIPARLAGYREEVASRGILRLLSVPRKHPVGKKCQI